MKDALKYEGRVEGKVIKLPSKRFRKEVTENFADSQIEVFVRKKKKRRSNAQNRWYWGVAIEIICNRFREWSPDVLFTPELTHALLKERFLPIVLGGEKQNIVIPDTGEVIDVPYSTTLLSTTQFMHYKDLIQAFAADFEIYIPDPNEEFENTENNIDKN